MRFIGNLPSEQTAIKFSDVLLALGIDHQIEIEGSTWALWVHAEEERERVTGHLTEFLKNPAAHEFEARAREGAVKRRILDEDAAGPRSVDGQEIIRRALPHGVGALTAVIMGSCLAISCAIWAGHEVGVFEELLLTRITFEPKLSWDTSLPEIFKGAEFWRLITPALVHINAVHLLLNMLCWIDLGSAIEARQGTGRLGILFLTIAIGSNLAQAWLDGPAFCGISGVLYGMLGYIWMKGKFDPACGLALHPYTVVLMLIFFVLGFGQTFTVVFGFSMANGAHAAGLILGITWGILTSLPQILRRRRGENK